MGVLFCKRCKATAEGKTFDEADAKIDHSIGKSKGWPCSGASEYLVWNRPKADAKKEPQKEQPKQESQKAPSTSNTTKKSKTNSKKKGQR